MEERDPEYDDKVGQRLDGRSLVQEWQQAHPQGAYVWNSKQLAAAANAPAILACSSRTTCATSTSARRIRAVSRAWPN